MINLVLRNIGRFLFLVLFQVLVLDNIQLGAYLNPFMYVLFILLMPFETPGWLLLISAFLLGFSIDLFEHTPGIHASAMVLMAFLRPAVLKMIAPREGYEPSSYPRIHYYGVSWFLQYSAILVFSHHLFLFYLEVFTFSGFFSTFLRIILSSIFSIGLIILSQFLIFKK
ncbi:MAG: rod shape-determining protein MreD [Bacteroidota bacterium]|nr:rod shape-determining protein MreD [Bacteroidota bacterium]